MRALLLSLLMVGQAGAFEWWQDASKSALRERVPCFYGALNDMFYKMITIPGLPNRVAYACFQKTGSMTVECLYLDVQTRDVYPEVVLPMDRDT